MLTKPNMIETLEPNQIFVFGSNADGKHAGGAAKQAFEHFGAEWGVGEGVTGQCYAVDTMSGVEKLTNGLEDFLRYAKKHQSKEFLLTKVGQGIAGYTQHHVQEMLDIAAYRVNNYNSSKLPSNVTKVGW